MKTCVILASGQSLKDEDVEYVRMAQIVGSLDKIIAVSNVGLDKAPWADALVSHDTAWWIAHPQALAFSGRRFSKRGYRCTEAYDPKFGTGINSGLMAMLIARDVFGAEKLILLGFDMHGTHYFGQHTALCSGKPLSNTTPSRFKTHIKQFTRFSGCEVINCTPNSALTIFPMMELKDAIQQ